MEQITLRYPNGEKKIETNNSVLLKDFIDWMKEYPHFSSFDEVNRIVTFSDKKFVSQCNIKWQLLCAGKKRYIS